MKTTTLFLLGLAVGAAVVFAVRAVSLDDATPSPELGHEGRAGAAHGGASSAGHDVGAHADHEDPTMPGDAKGGATQGHPSHDGEGVGSHEAHGGDPVAAADRPPENEICPVMDNPVDPTIYVDYEGRRIGFCCPGCDKVFLEDPETYLKKVDAELKKRSEK
jgi:YHS domain-containing protein